MEETVVNTEVKETPVKETTPDTKPSGTPPPSGEGVKETPVKESTDKVPYSRFSEVIGHKNEAIKRAEAAEARLKEFEAREVKSKPREEVDPFANLSPEEKEQTEKFIDEFVKPRIMNEFRPFINEIQTEKLNKQIGEAKALSDKVGINFEERLPEVVDFLSRPENKGRLTAKEAVLSLYGEEILEKARSKGKEELSQETKELMEKKKLANMATTSVNPNAVIHSDDMARKGMSSDERLAKDVRDAMELAKQGVKNPKVRTE